jgi:hypothetical protein
LVKQNYLCKEKRFRVEKWTPMKNKKLLESKLLMHGLFV